MSSVLSSSTTTTTMSSGAGQARDDHDVTVVRRASRRGAGDGPRAGFVPLSKTPKAATFTGDSQSLSILRRRVERSNFESRTTTEEILFGSRRREGRVAAPTVDRSRPPKEYVAIVDAFSTGACLAYSAARRGYGIVHVLSLEPSEELAAMVPAHLRGVLPWAETLYLDLGLPLSDGARRVADALEAFVATKDAELACVCAGAETGVKLADLCSAAIVVEDNGSCPKVRTNGARLSEARRNKAEMGEAVRRAGVRAVRQCRASAWPPVLEWLRRDWGLALDAKCDNTAEENTDEEQSELLDAEKCLLIVKPLESAGSDGVTACHSVGDVKRAVASLVGRVNGLGQTNEGVLVQEFLRGTEYCVDGVSRDGQHKVAAIWEYDRRATNGAGFVLHGQILLGGGEKVVEKLVPYAAKVLDALELRHGPSHMEVKLTPPPFSYGGFEKEDDVDPCLVEVGARCHGAEGFWQECADAACGRNQVDAACYY